MIRYNLCNYSDAYIHVKGTITFWNTGTESALNIRNKKVIFKGCAPLTNWVSEINNTQVHNAHDIDIVMHMYDLKNIANPVRKHQKVYSNAIEMKQL